MKNINRFAVVATVLAGLAAPASAVIVSGTLTGGNFRDFGGDFVKTNAGITPDVGVNMINTRNVYGLDEGHGTLTAATRFWEVAALSTVPARVNIGVGTRVASHLIFIDPSTVPDPASASGTVTFGSRILGYQWGGADLAATTAPLGAMRINYGQLMQLETWNDEISFTGRTLNYSFVSSARTGDFVRVITAVPESATWLMLVAGFGIVGMAARRRLRPIAA